MQKSSPQIEPTYVGEPAPTSDNPNGGTFGNVIREAVARYAGLPNPGARFDPLVQALMPTSSVETTLVELGFAPEGSVQLLNSLLALMRQRERTRLNADSLRTSQAI
jgi:hypothetical protein